ncbi:PREDICTED: uncharacterized protein LOC104601683 [Nelumbo nucifera]|uniref:Uncharacterized protein LOC104601683 n=1 Tax=Nelumbo nucifera TaxID=4432 RepID=A0A1U8AD73_NELNU|nr:PREDICTED: uncharacterized protein LOC104601683 [Nelumbo nucifera]
MDAFTSDIISKPFLPHFKALALEMYDGMTDLDDHLESFKAFMLLYSSWEKFASLFLTHFISSKRSQKSIVSLMPVKQKRGESLRSYIDHFKKEEIEVQDLDPMVSMHAAINGLLPGSTLRCSVAKIAPKFKAEFLKKAQKYITAEEASIGDRQVGEIDCQHGSPEKRRKNGDHCSNNSNNKKPPTPGLAYNQYTPLNSTWTQILMQVEKEEYMKWPKKMKRNPKRGNPEKYYNYHRDTSHDKDCYELKNEIESVIRHSHLK